MITFTQKNKKIKRDINNYTPFAVLYSNSSQETVKIKFQGESSITVNDSFMSISSRLLADCCVLHSYKTTYGCLSLNISPYFDIIVEKISDSETIIYYPTDDEKKGYIVLGNAEHIFCEIEKTQKLIKHFEKINE